MAGKLSLQNRNRRLNTRPPLDRMMQIFQAVKGNRYPNREYLSGVVEAAVKTVQRDLDFMRDRLQIPIEYHRERKGYYFTQEMQQFPMVELTEAELISVFVAQRALVQYRGTSFEAPLQSAFQKLVSGLSGTITVAWEELDAAIAFRSPETLAPETRTFQVVSEAAKLSRMITFQYKKLESTDYEPRRLEPYQLICFRNQWYCMGHDLDRDAVRTFMLTRMREPALGLESFKRPEKFSVHDHLKNSFGIFSGTPGKAQNVVLRFDSTTAQLVRERKWHVSQQTQDLAGGELEVTLTVNSFFEVEAWIMSWGDHVHVLAPKALIRRVKETAERVAAKYSSTLHPGI